MDDPDNAVIYALNPLCNYNPNILLLLLALTGIAFDRDKNGHFVKVKED